MPRSSRVLAPALTAIAGLVLAGATVGLGSTSAVAAGSTAGSAFTLKSGVSLSGYDAATTKDGTTYVAWIGDTGAGRQLHLCVLKPSARSCSGGTQTGNSLGGSSAQNVKVVVDGNAVELVWIAQPNPDSGEFSGTFGTNTVTNGSLGTSVAVSGAPTLGTLGAAISHNGDISLAAIGGTGTYDHRVYYYPTIGATPKTFSRPYYVGNVQLADNGKQTVMTTSAYGSLSGKVAVASKSSGSSSWGSFTNVSKSYTKGGIEQLGDAHGKIRLLSASTKELYTPYIWKWNGKSFGNPKSTGDKTEISSFDAGTDSSGRLVNVSQTVSGEEVSNFGGGLRATHFGIPVKQTFAGGSGQIATSASGRGYVIYSIEKLNITGQILLAQPIKLGALTKTVHKSGRGGKVSLTGPASCLPVAKVKTSVSGKPDHGWRVASKSLQLGSAKQGGSLDGASLKAGTSYTLHGTVVFANGSAHSSVMASLSFKTCDRP